MIASRRNQIIAQVFLILLGVLWMLPMIGMLMASFRPFSDTASNGFFSWQRSLFTAYVGRCSWCCSCRRWWRSSSAATAGSTTSPC